MQPWNGGHILFVPIIPHDFTDESPRLTFFRIYENWTPQTIFSLERKDLWKQGIYWGRWELASGPFMMRQWSRDTQLRTTSAAQYWITGAPRDRNEYSHNHPPLSTTPPHLKLMLRGITGYVTPAQSLREYKRASVLKSVLFYFILIFS
jgi:hypothetical protein